MPTTIPKSFVPDSPSAPSSFVPDAAPNSSDGLLKTVGKAIFKGAVVDPYKALLVKPAARTAEALGSLGIFGSNVKRGYESEATTGQDVGGVHIEPVKAFGQGGGKQILGEGLEAGTDIASLALGGSSKALKANTFVKGAIQGAKTGALTGGIFGAGQGAAKALQDNKSTGEIFTQGAAQGAVGAVTGGIVGGVLGGATGAIRGAIERHQAITAGLGAERQPTNVIEYSKDPTSGKISVDKSAKAALDQGIAPTDVQFVKNAGDADKQAFREMYKTALETASDKTVAKNPYETVGKTLVDQAKYVGENRSVIGKQLGDAAKAMVQTPLDTTPAVSKFEETLGNAGIFADSKGQLDFDASRYADQPTVQKALQRVYDSVDDKMTPQSIILARQKIFTNNNYAKAANEIVPGDFADSIIGQLYDSLDDPLKAANPKYGELAQKYAQASGTLRDFGSLIGKNFDLGDKFTNLRAGEVANRTLSNSSAQTMSTISALQDTAQNLGYKGEGNVRNQALFANMLQDSDYNFFKPTQVTSLRSRIAQGTMDAAKTFKGGFFPGISNLAEKGLKAAEGISPEGQRLALEKLIGFTQGAFKLR